MKLETDKPRPSCRKCHPTKAYLHRDGLIVTTILIFGIVFVIGLINTDAYTYYSRGNIVNKSTDQAPAVETRENETGVSLPPAPHNPKDRVFVHTHNGWEFRAFARNDHNHSHRASRGELHVQLWHPTSRISVLTPSMMTKGQYDVWLSSGQYRVSCLHQLSTLTRSKAGIVPPCKRVISHFQTWLVWGPSICATYRAEC